MKQIFSYYLFFSACGQFFFIFHLSLLQHLRFSIVIYFYGYNNLAQKKLLNFIYFQHSCKILFKIIRYYKFDFNSTSIPISFSRKVQNYAAGINTIFGDNLEKQIINWKSKECLKITRTPLVKEIAAYVIYFTCSRIVSLFFQQI